MAGKKNHESVVCQICRTQKRLSEMVPAGVIRGPITERIKAACPDWSPSSYICLADLNRFRSDYVEEAIKQDKGELTTLEEQVVKSLEEHELLTKNLNVEYDRQLSLGERLADKLADFGGSWRFIGIFGAILFLWIVVNSALLITKPFDPYPYIFLNLVLSCLAAIQAPVIMMSQNRQEEKDRLRAEHDYRVNLKAELEIRHLHEKLDHLLIHQWQRLLEIQEIQTELLQGLSEKHSHS
jgi:uncharacterized membrane protein